MKADAENEEFLEALERDFLNVIAEMSGDRSIEQFRKRFQELYDALKSSHENERAILQKCKELNNNISMGLSYMKNSEGLTRKDAQTIQLLASELEKAGTIIQMANAKADKDRTRIEHLKQVLEDLKNVIKQSEGEQSGKTNEIMRLNQEAVLLQKEIEESDRVCASTQEEIKRQTELLRSIHKQQVNYEDENKKSLKTLTELQERLKSSTSDTNKLAEDINKVVLDKETINKERDAVLKVFEREKAEEAALNERSKELAKEIGMLNHKKIAADQKLTALREKIEKLKEENESKHQFNKLKDEEIKVLSGAVTTKEVDLAQTKRNKEKKITEIQRCANERDDAIKMISVLKTQILELQREIEQTDKTADQDQELVDNLLRDQNTIKKNFIAIVKENQAQQLDLETRTKDCEKMKDEVKVALDQVNKRVKDISNLELEKEKYIKECKQAIKKYLHLSEEIKLKDNLISEFQKKTQETESKLKHQQQLYEAVRSDRNVYSKNLTETQDEIAEIKLRYKIVMHQISQLKEEISAKEASLKEHIDRGKTAEKEFQKLEKDNEKLKKDIDDRKQTIMNLRNEIGKLQFIMKESGQARLKLKQQYETVVSDRDILGTQLIRRNDELALIYEKIKMQQNTLAKGEAEYRERVSDIEILDNTIRDLTRELTIFKRRANDLGKFYQEIAQISKELIEEKLKVKGLSEELENPKNKYRWRNLEGSDCDTNELISKIEALQKRLISKTEEVVAKDLVINTQEQTIKNLEQVMSKQPGLAEAEEISFYQQAIKARTRKLKSLAAELNMYQAQSNEYKEEIEKLITDVEQAKKELYDIRRREQLMLEQEKRERREQETKTEENIQMI